MKKRKANYSGHKCELRSHQSMIWDLYPGIQLWSKVRRRVLKFFTVSEHQIEMGHLKSEFSKKIERVRHWKNYRFVIHPFSDANFVWTLLMDSIYTLFAIVYPLMFVSGHYGWVYSLILIFCWLDIFLNFQTGYYEQTPRRVILDRRAICRHYLKTNFIFDVASSLPFHVFENIPQFQEVVINDNISIFVKCLPYLGALKFIRVVLTRNRVQQRCENLNTMLLFALLGDLALNVQFIGWISFVFNLCDSTLNEKEMEIEGTVEVYFRCVASAVTFITWSGCYFETKTIEQSFISCGIWIYTFIFSIYYMAQLLKIIDSLSSSSSKYQLMVRQLRAYMNYKKLPSTLQHQLLQYYEFRFGKSYFNENEILKTVSEKLSQEVVLHTCRQLVENVQIFQGFPLPLIIRIVSSLISVVALPNDVIILANTPGDSMYFIATGTVAIFTSSGNEVCHLQDGAHFGEVALVLHENRCATVVAIETCELYKLRGQDFMRAIQPYPDLLEEIERFATERLERTNLLDDLEAQANQ